MEGIWDVVQPILWEVLQIALALLVMALVPYLAKALRQWLEMKAAREKLEAERTLSQELAWWALEVVRAAAERIPEKSARYEWAAKQLCLRFPWLDEDRTRVLIESAVREFKLAWRLDNLLDPNAHKITAVPLSEKLPEAVETTRVP